MKNVKLGLYQHEQTVVRRSLFIAIEGGDGSGKKTQSQLLTEYLKNDLKRDVLMLSFPRYGEDSAYYAGKYLDGAYGDANDVHPDIASLTFAIDRFATKSDLDKHLKKPGAMVVSDRYVASNLAHQGTKFATKEERLEYYKRMMNTEFNILGVPKPDINIVLVVPTHTAQSNVDKKDASTRSYTTKKRDVHEADSNHLEKAKANYEELCKLYPKEFIAIKCTDKSGNMYSIENIQEKIRKALAI